jgi:hypothetical protein
MGTYKIPPNKLTKCLKQSHSWKDNSRSVTQEMPRFLRNPNSDYHIQSSFHFWKEKFSYESGNYWMALL